MTGGQPRTSGFRSGPFLLLLLGLLSLYSLGTKRLSFGACEETKSSIYSNFENNNVRRTQQHNDTMRHNRTVHFLNPSDFGSYGEYYSGMWWQRRDHFMNTNYTEIELLEEASFQSFQENRDIRLTRDWMDFAVEHLSQYVKLLLAQDAVADSIAAVLAKYIQRTEPFHLTNDDLAVHSTLAVLPLRVTSNHPKENDLLALELAATLISLWKVGIPRAVVVGVSEQEEVIANQSFAFVQKKMASSAVRDPMELHSIEYVDASSKSKRLVPKIALRALQTAFQQSEQQIEMEHVHSWLGSHPERWKYVYFSEPDLVLQMRDSAMSAISRTLQEGRLMAAHRLEPVPHARDFPWVDSEILIDRVVPNSGVFAVVHDIDPFQDACCDQGRYYPAHRASPHTQEEVRLSGSCLSSWVHCGFLQQVNYHDPATMLEMHRRLVGYPFFTIQGGTGLPLLGANQRMCLPKKNDVCGLG